MPDVTHDYDVLIVGGGSAACSAAHAALEKTQRVCIIEKSTKRDRGGNSAMTGHIRFVFNGVEDLRPLVRNMSDDELRKLLDCGLPQRTEEMFWDEMMRATNNQSDPELLQVHVTESLKTVQWLAGKGHDWVPASLTNDNVLTMNGGGAGLQKRNFEILERAGVPFQYETAATELIQDAKGRVTGVRALTPDGYAVFNAKAVVVACGGFEANAEMRALSGTGVGHHPGARRAFQHGRRAAHGDGYRRAFPWKLDDVPRVSAGHQHRPLHRAFGPRARRQHQSLYVPDRHQLDGKCTAGIHPPKRNYALEIDKPPFEAWPVRCGITFTFGGLKIDPNTAQVQHVAGRPIPGLYAAGEMVGGLFAGGYASGSGMMSGATFGRIAGTNASAYAKA